MSPKESLPMSVTPLASFPPMSQWDDWKEHDAGAWPEKVERHYTLVPMNLSRSETPCAALPAHLSTCRLPEM